VGFDITVSKQSLDIMMHEHHVPFALFKLKVLLKNIAKGLNHT
jgi:hypothetical protein